MAEHAEATPDSWLVAGDNVEGLYRAERIRVLRSTAEYYDVALWALERAERQVMLVGWDLHGEVRLRRGEEEVTLYEALGAALERAPELQIRIGIWDSNLYYKVLGEWFQGLKFGARFGDRLRYERVATPPEASAHQKALVVDDRVGFLGGVDFAQSRWDTAEHRLDDPRRINPKGRSYAPHHDVQMMMDGHAARRLGALLRERWQWATGEVLEAPTAQEAPSDEPWPVEPDGRGVDVGLARTVPPWAGEGGGETIREAERLWQTCVDRAERYLYVETQYISDESMVKRMMARLRQPQSPEIVVVTPATGGGTMPEQETIGALNKRNILRLIEADAGRGRFLAVCPQVRRGRERINPYIHAKCCVVDDRLVRVGSSNMADRSMGTDLELDCAVELPLPSACAVRDALLGNHLGLSPQEVHRRLEASGGSMIRMIDGHRGEHTLARVSTEGGRDMIAPELTQLIVDPSRPYEVGLPHPTLRRVRHALGKAPLLRIGTALAVALAVGSISLWGWRRAWGRK